MCAQDDTSTSKWTEFDVSGTKDIEFQIEPSPRSTQNAVYYELAAACPMQAECVPCPICTVIATWRHKPMKHGQTSKAIHHYLLALKSNKESSRCNLRNHWMLGHSQTFFAVTLRNCPTQKKMNQCFPLISEEKLFFVRRKKKMKANKKNWLQGPRDNGSGRSTGRVGPCWL